MAAILDFVTRDEYEARRFAQNAADAPADTAVLTPLEVYTSLTEMILTDVGGIIRKLKATGRWTAAADPHMQKAFDSLAQACAVVAGVKHGKTA